MRSQRKSETVRKGSPYSHERAVHFVADFLGFNWDQIFVSLPSIYAPFNYKFSDKFVQENKLDYRIHSYDLGCTIGKEPKLIVEIGSIGDDSKHNPSHKQQLINDGIAKKNIEENHPDCLFFRINKEDALLKDYLEKLFFRKIKRSF